jgi:hypothetical protein
MVTTTTDQRIKAAVAECPFKSPNEAAPAVQTSVVHMIVRNRSGFMAGVTETIKKTTMLHQVCRKNTLKTM